MVTQLGDRVVFKVGSQTWYHGNVESFYGAKGAIVLADIGMRFLVNVGELEKPGVE
jgi:hypothetical protein